MSCEFFKMCILYVEVVIFVITSMKQIEYQCNIYRVHVSTVEKVEEKGDTKGEYNTKRDKMKGSSGINFSDICNSVVWKVMMSKLYMRVLSLLHFGTEDSYHYRS